MKIAWASNAPWVGTGYGQQTALMLPRLRAAGHEVAAIANWGLAGGRMEWEGFPVYPMGLDNASNDMIPAHALHWFDDEPGVLVVLYDAWPLFASSYKDLDMAVWCPVDHTPAPPLVAEHFNEHGSTPIAMSQFGKTQLELYGLEPLYAPHGVDTKVFAPTAKAEAKQLMGFDPDRFLVGMVSTNNSNRPIRKAYGQAFAAFSMMRDQYPDAQLYFHAANKARGNGVDVTALANGRGIPPDAMKMVDEYRYLTGMISPTEMALLYSAFDVLLFPSMGEGFGIPALEAQACGTPVIVSDFSAQAELVAPGLGYKVAAQPEWDSSQNADFCVPLIEDLADALCHAAAHRDQLADAGKGCREWAMGYDADRVFDYHWRPTLKALEGRLASTDPIVAAPVA